MAAMDSDSDLTDVTSGFSSPGSTPPPPSPHHYPSPPSSQDQSVDNSGNEQTSWKRPCGGGSDDLPTAKMRKTVKRRPRITAHLDLRSPLNSASIDQSSQLGLLHQVLRKRRKIVVIAGAGISTSAGSKYSDAILLLRAHQFIVPDFRSSNGLFNTLRRDNKLKASGKHLFDASVYQTDSSTTSFHDMVRTLSGLVSGANPTAFHEMLATIASEGRLMRLYSQNVDGIDTSLPPLATSVPLSTKGPWPQTIQLHGSLEKMVCSKCNSLSDFNATLFNGPNPPPCTVCIETDKIRTDHAGKRSHGIGKLRPRMVLYNEHNPDEEAIGTVVTADLRARPDAVIVVGTSMEIPGVKRIVREMCGVVRDRKDGLAMWINRGPPPTSKEFEDCWDLVVAGDCDKVAQQANMPLWNDVGIRVTTEEAEEAKQKDGDIKVIVNSPKKRTTSWKNIAPALDSAKVKPTQKPKISLNFPPLNHSDTKEKLSKSGATKAVALKSAKATSKPSSQNGLTKSKNSKPSGMARMNSVFKVTKSRSFAPKKKTKALSTSTIVAKETSVPSIPMGPISPQSARSNSALPSTPKALFPNLKTVEPLVIPPEHFSPNLKPIEVPTINDTGRLKRMSEEIVSPVGATPPDIKRLLN